jgi:hypothetical protein
LNRLKGDEGFSDMPCDPGPGGLALCRYLADPAAAAGTTNVDLIVVTGAGEVLRFAENIPLVEPMPRKAA